MTLAGARAQFAAGPAHTPDEHVAACAPPAEALAVPDGWTVFAGTIVAWLFLRGALLTGSGTYSVTAQVYHLLEYFASALLKLMAGRKTKLFRINLEQQLEAARDGRYYVKKKSRPGGELCLGYECWNIAFCAFPPGQCGNSSGEGTLVKLIGGKVEALKEAVGTARESAFFRLVVPEEGGPAASTLVAGKRKIFEKTPGDHAFSTGRIGLPRLCSRGDPSAADYRFLHQDGAASVCRGVFFQRLCTVFRQCGFEIVKESKQFIAFVSESQSDTNLLLHHSYRLRWH